MKVHLNISNLEAKSGCEKEVIVDRNEKCLECMGTGIIGKKNNCNICTSCNGEGIVNKKVKIKVKIPKGIENKQPILLKNEGNTCPFVKDMEKKEMRGNLYIVVHIVDFDTVF